MHRSKSSFPGLAIAERDRAVQNATRYGSLANSGYGSRENADRTLADRLKAEAAVRSAQAAAEAARAALPVLESECAAAEGKRAEAAASLALAERNLDQTVIRAPFDGVVGNRSAQLGAHVRPGQNLIAVAPPPERQWVVANFKETQLAAMRRGQPVELEFDTGGPVLHGRVESLAPATGAQFSLLPPENATGNFTRVVQRVPVRVRLDPAEVAAHPLRVGLSMDAKVDISNTGGRMLADASAAPRAMATAVFEQDGAQTDALVQRIVAANMAPAGARAVAKTDSKSVSQAPAGAHAAAAAPSQPVLVKHATAVAAAN